MKLNPKMSHIFSETAHRKTVYTYKKYKFFMIYKGYSKRFPFNVNI
jgi:hypothetical protein